MSTYTPISSFTATTSVSSVTIAGIPQNYTDLVLVVNGEVSTSQQIALQFNSDTGSNYSVTSLYGDGSSAASARNSSTTSIVGGFGWFGSATIGTSIINIQNYSNATTYKTAIGRGNLSSAYVHAGVGLWRNTSAITSINMFVFGGYNWNSGATFNLYGIDASLSAQAKATGGTTIIRDNSYWYHVFTKSGTFAPTESITADVLVVAGGGGGASGGGGAGGLLTFTSQSLTAQNYTCTVGAGGAGGTGANNGTVGVDSQFGSLTLVKGGGYGGDLSQVGGNGGSGGGGGAAASGTFAGGTATSSQGNNGGSQAGQNASPYYSGGGGGAGAVGGNASGSASGAGGVGSSSYSSWGSATSTGQNVGGTYYYAGGGGGAPYLSGTTGAGGSGGGAAGGDGVTNNGTANTGGGGGGRDSRAGGGAGGSGIVIIRYAV